MIRIGFQNNPRRVRRYVGTYNLTLAMLSASGAQSVERIRQVAILLMLRQEYPDLFTRVQADPGAWQRLLHEDVQDPDLVTILNRISDRSQFDFPPPPSADLVLALSEVIVMTGVAPEEQT